MADANLSDLFENSVQVTTNELTCDLNPGEVDHSEAPNRVLLGKLYYFSRLGRKAIQGSLNNAWSSLVGWSWKEREDGLLQFTFQSSWDADNVLLRRPWLVCGHLLVLMPWPSWLTPSEVVFDQTPLWVRLKSIPPFYWNKTNLQELAGKVSASYELPRHIEKFFERGSFGMGTLRFRAIVDIEKPLFSGFYLRRKGIKDLWIRYQYEKLPKMCFKCGALSHDLKFCFKTPTVIKDEKRSFFPMFGTWMNEDAVERSPFHLPLPKWFSDWILQQQTVKDPETRNKLRIERRWKEAEAMECRELRRQLPGKRRQVEVLVEKRPATKEVVMNRFPAVHLPGIGEITPFENTADMVVEKEMPVHPNPMMGTSPGESSNKTDAGRAVSSEETTTEKDGTILSHTNRSEASPNIAHDRELEKLPEKGGTILSTAKNPEPHTPSPHPSYLGVQDRENFTLQEKFQFGQFINSLLGPQAQPLEWPSRLCWARAFEPLMGSTTIDKFHREPTLFNPILDIEDFKCMETEHGPKKRKAVDGFYMIPWRLQSYDEGPSGVVTPEAKNKQVNHNSDEGGMVAQFSPGSNEQAIQKRKRGRPRKINDPCKSPSSYTKKESITMPNERIGVKTKSLKRRKKGSSIKGNSSQYRNLWNVKGIDLTIDLDNHFVVVEKAKKQYPGWVICNILETGKNAICGTIESDPPGVKWTFLGIYGPPANSGKEVFWSRIGDTVSKSSSPIVLFGDLNGTLADYECINYDAKGGDSRGTKRLQQPKEVLRLKRARLDRALASTEWRILFPNAIVELLTVSTSDHKPIMLNTEGGARCSKPQFKYELMWGRDPRCFWVVRNAWREELHTNPMINLYQLFGNEDANAILNIDLPEVNTDDSWQWVGEYNGLFSIKSAYRLIKSTVSRTNEEDVWKLMWNSPIHPRLKFLWWQVVWSERNRRVHGEKETDLIQILRLIRLKVKEHLLVANQKVVNILAWAPPPPQWACCNSDVAVLPNGSMLAAVIRDDSGSILSISTQEASYTDPLVAEAKAVCFAAKVAAEAATTQCNVDFRIEAAKMRFVQYCSMFEEWEITHISRMCNFAAHNVAKWAAMGRKSGAFVPHDMDSGVLDDLREWDPGPPNQLSSI
ncbi:hypothetical protein F8388_025009 [Cannabis sativa]|uniref:Uncharacterized protein n=1 Tax=Cannabis sativa TaxID=3483 RepID=A0A7J6G3T2_CANSA|nr:hypothetical protein F8388_025009 [Cannabis sativa]